MVIRSVVLPARRMRVVAAVCGGLVVTLLAASCGLPSDGGAIQVARGDVPYGLLDTATVSSAQTATPGVPLSEATIYFVDGQQKLVPVAVQVPSAQILPLVQTLLTRLAAGPTERERSRGLVSDLSPASAFVLRSVFAGTATIELQSTNQDPSASKLPVAVGQIVLTATSVVGIDRVAFVRDNQPVAVPLPPVGNVTTSALTMSDYESLLAPGTTQAARTEPLAGPTGTVTSTTTAPPGA